MVEENPDDEPILRPYVVSSLKDRPRLVDYGIRRRVLEEMEENIEERRRPDEISGRVATSAIRTAEEITFPVVEGLMNSGARIANQTILSGR